MIGISEEEFKKRVSIYFNNINEGFSNFKSKVLEENYNSQGDFIGFISECFKLNGVENSYVDFYYYNLSIEDRERLRSFLDKDERKFLEKHIENINKDAIYFKLTEEFIEFLTNISLKEILFSTFYFTKIPCTIWGNYNRKFPIFFKSEKEIEFYDGLSENYGLKIV